MPYQGLTRASRNIALPKAHGSSRTPSLPITNHPWPSQHQTPSQFSSHTLLNGLSYPQTESPPTGSPSDPNHCHFPNTWNTSPRPRLQSSQAVMLYNHVMSKEKVWLTGLGEHPLTCRIMKIRIGHKILRTQNKRHLLLKLVRLSIVYFLNLYPACHSGIK